MTITASSVPRRGFTHYAAALLIGMGINFTVVPHVQARNPTPATLLRKDAPQVYVVKRGDTLWDIAGRFLNRPYRWREIWASNRHIRNPHWIYPGDRILLCSLNGKPLIGRDEGDGCAGIIRRAGGSTTPHVRVEALNNSIPLIPLDNIKNWLERSIVVAPDSITQVPYVLGMQENRVIAGEADRIFVRGLGLELGKRYGIYRVGEPYNQIDEKGKPYPVAIELTQIARGLDIEHQGDIATFEIERSFNGEIRKGDLILPEFDPMFPTMFYPVPAKGVLEGGQIIRVLGSVGVGGTNSVVAINRGRLDGTDIGQVFTIQQLGELTTDPKTHETIRLPNERIGNGMVFRTFDHISYVYVTDSTMPIKLGAMVVAPTLDN